MSGNVDYVYSKPFGFQRIEKRSASVDLTGQRHDLNKSTPPSNASYNMAELLRPSNPSQLFDDTFPEFVGPLAIRNSTQCGRGVFATEDILAGDLIIAVKALAIVFPNKGSASSKLWREVQKLGSLRQEIGTLIQNDPSKASIVYHLYAGPKLGYLEPQDEDKHDQNITEVDMDRIERICSFNAFQGAVQGYSAESCFGLWYFPSFINHDCLGANARWTIFKNFMFIRAHRPIAKDSEVLISYVDPNDTGSFRRNFFLKHEFFCACALCRTERTEGQTIRRRREIILEDWRDSQVAVAHGESDDEDDSEAALENVLSVIMELESLRPAQSHLNVFLIQPLLDTAFRYYEKGNYEEALPFFLRAFDLCSLSSQISLLCVSCAFTISTCFVRRNKMKLAAQWVEISKTWVVNTYGTVDVIQILRPAFFKEMTRHQLL